jgi:sugar phosphate isomerase/epimerase
MEKQTMSRRAFVGGAVAGVMAAGLVQHAGAEDTKAVDGHAIRLGAPVDAGSDDPEALALAHRKLGYRAAYCPDVKLADKDRIRNMSEAFAKHDVVIAEVGRWCNLLEADEAKRKENLKTVIDGLALAEEIGARCCVNIAGSYNKETWFGPHPDNLSKQYLDAAVENARTIIDAVNPVRAKFGYEMMGWALPDSPDAYLALIKAVDRRGFGVHLDPCNAVNCPQRFYRNTELLNECFEKLGPYIVSCHAKDLVWDVEMNVHFREVGPGQGKMDYATWLKGLAALPGDVPLMMEHLASVKDYDAPRQYLFELGPKVGVRFE